MTISSWYTTEYTHTLSLLLPLKKKVIFCCPPPAQSWLSAIADCVAERRRRSGCWPPGAGLSCRPVIGQVGVTEDPGAQSALTGRGAGDARRCACGPAEWLVGVGAALALKKDKDPPVVSPGQSHPTSLLSHIACPRSQYATIQLLGRLVSSYNLATTQPNIGSRGPSFV